MTCASITIAQGATLRLRLTYRNPDGAPMDLTGHAFYAQVRAWASPPSEPLDQLECQTDDAAIGVVTIEGHAALTHAWPVGQLKLGIMRVEPGGLIVQEPIVRVVVTEGAVCL